MASIQIHDKHFVPFIDRDRINKYVEFLADQIAQEIGPDEVPIFIGILNGSFMFAADFVRKYPNECHITFVKMASYEGVNSTGKIKHLVGINEDLTGKTVVILEDIIDTGNTLAEIYEIFRDKRSSNLRLPPSFLNLMYLEKNYPLTISVNRLKINLS